MTTTRTYALLAVTAATYDEIRRGLERAGYDHAFLTKGGAMPEEHIDMHGIALVRQAPAIGAAHESRTRTFKDLSGPRVPEPTHLSAGDEVLLIEGRGCWQVRKLVQGDVFFPDEPAIQLLRPSYHRHRYVWTGYRSQTGQPIFMTEEPMIGRVDMAYAETLLPAHWQPPVGA